MDDSSASAAIESRLEKLEKEMQGLRKFVTTLETGHESRAKAWNKKLGVLSQEIEELKVRFRKTKKKVKKLRR
jgi:predicted RNase H-like nuclease (RuvC/YqgF family)